LLPLPARPATQPPDDLDAAVGRGDMGDPLLRPVANAQRPGQLHQAVKRFRRQELGIIHGSGIARCRVRSRSGMKPGLGRSPGEERRPRMNRPWKAALAVLATIGAAAAAPPPTRVAQLAWLSGAWAEERNGVWTEERWAPPRGGVMLGASVSG